MPLLIKKGGTGKTVTTENLGIGLANEGKKVLLVDFDPQGSLTISLGFPKPDEMYPTISDMLGKVIQERTVDSKEAIINHQEGVIRQIKCGLIPQIKNNFLRYAEAL